MTKKREKILVAMSGGVDSSVSAYLLLKQGYDVTGVFMKQWSDSVDVSGVCTWKEDRRDAIRVAAHLGIPLITFDFEKEYKKWVMDYMFREYKKGRTPNPDILCNKYIKFGVWLDKAKELGYNKLATGHYASLQKDGKYHLLEAKDKNKDQTYFLHQLNQKQLQNVLFPLGKYTKVEVRKIAEKNNLPTAKRKDSVGICFIGEVSMKDFLLQKIKSKKGNVVTSSGKVVGKHDGLAFYTIGQRHLGMQNAELRMQNGNVKPMYVIDKNLNKNELVVGDIDNPLLYKKEIEVVDINWISRQESVFPIKCKVRLRHRQEKQNAELRMQNKKLIIKFKKPQKAVTPGQFAVFYKNGECLGGGVVK
jgi:tRNA-specific 2-thiouridylase